MFLTKSAVRYLAITACVIPLGGSRGLGNKPDTKKEWCEAPASDKVFDYIVVGSGAGGGVVASRLAEAGFETLLLDAGPDLLTETGPETQAVTSIPLFHPRSTIDSAIEWAFRVKNSDDEGRDNVLYPRSSNLGGCSVHNAMSSVYSYPDTWNNMKKLTKDPEWDELKMRERLIRMENNQYLPDDILSNLTPEQIAQETGHGVGGFFSTSHTDMDLLLTLEDDQLNTALGTVQSTFDILGKDTAIEGDVNAPGGTSSEGWHPVPNAINIGENGVYSRSSVYNLIKTTQANPAAKLTVKTLSFVTKVLVKKAEDGLEDKPTAYGVKVQEGKSMYKASTGAKEAGDRKTYFARKEVIVSGGAFNTPQILMLSGIGPKDLLNKHGIKVVADVPGVGKNLQDKIETNIIYEVNKDWKLFNQGCTFLQGDDPCFIDYLEGKPSIYGGSGLLLGLQQKSSEDLAYPDVYSLFTPFYFNGYNDQWVEQAFGSTNKMTLNSITTPSNTGRVKIKSKDPFDVVDVDFNGYLKADLLKSAGVVKNLRDYVNYYFSEIIKEEILPGSRVTDEKLPKYVRKNGWGHHACCSAKIGADGDAMAVLDGQMKVRAVNNLRVVDASSFPKEPGSFVAVSIMMLAEKAADDIISVAAETSISRKTIGCDLELLEMDSRI